MAENMLNYDYLDDTIYQILLVPLFVSSMLSIYGSLSSIVLILRQNKLKEVYHRLVFGMSVADILLTISLLLIPFLLRKDLGLPLAIGNEQTCDALGFMFQFYVASSFYNANLSLFFVCKIIYNRSDRPISKRFEPYIHVLPFFFALTFGVVGVSLQLFNPGFLIPSCDFWHYPANCAFDDTVECERGDHTLGFAIGYGVGTFHMVVATLAVAGTWSVYHSVQRQLHHTSSMSLDVLSTEDRYRKRLRIVMWNSILYTAVFLNTFAVAAVATGLNAIAVRKFVDDPDYEMGVGLILVRLLCYTLFPLQGFLNWIVYVRNRVARIKRVHLNRSWMWAMRHVYSSSALNSSRSGSLPRVVTSERVNRPRSSVPREQMDLSDKRDISLWDADSSSSLDDTDRDFFNRLRREISAGLHTANTERLRDEVITEESHHSSSEQQEGDQDVPTNDSTREAEHTGDEERSR